MLPEGKTATALPSDAEHGDRLARIEILLLALVLVAAHHAIPFSLLHWTGLGRVVYDRLGANAYGNVWCGVTAVVPLLLCISAPSRSGLKLGTWKSQAKKVVAVGVLPIVLTAIVYPFTSRPFTGGPVGTWLISPAAQDLLFTGYLYGLLDVTFPGTISKRVRVHKAVLLTAAFFCLWHVPNFQTIMVSYVVFQLVYVFIGGAWILLARQLTGSMLPGIVVHMAINFLAWIGW